MKASDFIYAVQLALKNHTVYAFGQIGSPLSDKIIMKATPYAGMSGIKNNQTTRAYALAYRNARSTAKTAPEGTFGFDCSGLIQGCLAGWNADTQDWVGGQDVSLLSKRYSANDLARESTWDWKKCSEEAWQQIKPGSLLFQSGDGGKTINHIAVYIGNGKGVECAYDWCGAPYGMTDGVQEFEFAGYENGYMMSTRNGSIGKRKWLGFGLLPMLDYTDVSIEEFNTGDQVKIKPNVITNYKGIELAPWVYDGRDLWVYNSDPILTRITVDKSLQAVTATMKTTDLMLVQKAPAPQEEDTDTVEEERIEVNDPIHDTPPEPEVIPEPDPAPVITKIEVSEEDYTLLLKVKELMELIKKL